MLVRLASRHIELVTNMTWMLYADPDISVSAQLDASQLVASVIRPRRAKCPLTSRPFANGE